MVLFLKYVHIASPCSDAPPSPWWICLIVATCLSTLSEATFLQYPFWSTVKPIATTRPSQWLCLDLAFHR